jgi:DNA polymerase II large subunit
MFEDSDAVAAIKRNPQSFADQIIENHFLPDTLRNRRMFVRQNVRCLDCGEKYRRIPLTGDCRECGGSLDLTVHKRSMIEYLNTAWDFAEEFGCRDYTRQRLEALEISLKSLFSRDVRS